MIILHCGTMILGHGIMVFRFRMMIPGWELISFRRGIIIPRQKTANLGPRMINLGRKMTVFCRWLMNLEPESAGKFVEMTSLKRSSNRLSGATGAT